MDHDVTHKPSQTYGDQSSGATSSLLQVVTRAVDDIIAGGDYRGLG